MTADDKAKRVFQKTQGGIRVRPADRDDRHDPVPVMDPDPDGPDAKPTFALSASSERR